MWRAASWRSEAFCALSQNSGVVRKAAPSFSAISALTDVRPLTMRFTTLTSHPSDSATCLWVRASGMRNSSLRISPGLVGFLRFFMAPQ